MNKPRIRVFTKSHLNTKPLYEVSMWMKWIKDDVTLKYISIKSVTDFQENYFYDLRQ
jgi:hypothetical protein